MAGVDERLSQIEQEVGRAVAAVERDTAASPVLTAVVRELHRKAGKALAMLDGADAAVRREAVVEVEQAADSAKDAAEADPGLGERARQAVIDAHMSICVLKGSM